MLIGAMFLKLVRLPLKIKQKTSLKVMRSKKHFGEDKPDLLINIQIGAGVASGEKPGLV